jgi:hypothetical protein
LDKVTVDDLVTEITPKARGKCPSPPWNTIQLITQHTYIYCF